MDVLPIIKQLKVERDKIRAALHHMEQLADREKPRRGRPPTWLVEARKRKGAANVD